jgi:glutathione S-transferase
VDRGSTRVGAFNKRFEPQESNIRKSSLDTAVRGSRDQLVEATGTKKLPTLKLPDGTIISHSRAILGWVREHESEDASEASRVIASSG